MTETLTVHMVYWTNEDAEPIAIGVTVTLEAAQRIANGWRFVKLLEWWDLKEADPFCTDPGDWTKRDNSHGLDTWERVVIDHKADGLFTGSILITAFYLIDDREEDTHARIPTGAAAGPSERPAARIAATAPDPGRPQPRFVLTDEGPLRIAPPKPCVRWCGSDASCPLTDDLYTTCKFHE